MAFLRSLSTKEMVEYVVCHFTCDRRRVAFPPSLLSKDFQALCSSYELAMAEEAARDYELPELPQPRGLGSCIGECFEYWSHPSPSFVGISLSPEFSKPGSEQRQNQRIVQGPVSRKRARRWSQRVRAQPLRGRPPLLIMTSRSIHPSGGRGITGEEGRQRTLDTPISPFIMVFPPLYDTREMADYRWRRATRSPRPLPEDYHVLCPRFSLLETEGAAANFELLKMVQAISYTMLLNEAVELCVVGGFMAKGLKSALVGLRWSSFEAWMSRVDHELRDAQLR
ncbi:hypothetical protein Cgig2_014486 [Carnegiea gigantea]|uniref:Uncharacterized protein n=1 Tax=Carnegiea gigantea TaxID=171969 RepID=A0A9Q1Q910_9CARY|nr:hypothetical protein Cgig2_014486 [Carnegiea gigantea]